MAEGACRVQACRCAGIIPEVCRCVFCVRSQQYNATSSCRSESLLQSVQCGPVFLYVTYGMSGKRRALSSGSVGRTSSTLTFVLWFQSLDLLKVGVLVTRWFVLWMSSVPCKEVEIWLRPDARQPPTQPLPTHESILCCVWPGLVV